MVKVSKRKKAADKLVDRNKIYAIEEAVECAKKASTAKFDETIDLNISLNINIKDSTQMVRGAVVLPYGTGKVPKIACFVKADKKKVAQDAGADYVGDDDLIEKLKTGWCEFDVAIATPDMMRELGKVGKILGPKGLMPSPKAGTVTNEIEKTIKEIKKGKTEYKTDKQGNINICCGKKSFENTSLIKNIETILHTIVSARPSSVKGNFIRNVFISPTMGPGIKLDITAITRSI